MITLLLIMLLSFNCSAASLPDSEPADEVIQQTTVDQIVEDAGSTEGLTEESTTEEVTQLVNDSVPVPDYGLDNLVSFGYIRELPESVTLGDYYILVVRIYNLILMAVWILIAFDVIDLVAKSIGRLKRKN